MSTDLRMDAAITTFAHAFELHTFKIAYFGELPTLAVLNICQK
jgi:hypothetical protein